MSKLADALRQTADCLEDVANGKGGWAWEEVLQEARAALAADGWEPIETAPRDGTAVLLYCPTFYFGPGVYLGWWNGSHFNVCTEGQTEYPYSDDGATHWQPLPAPPKEKP